MLRDTTYEDAQMSFAGHVENGMVVFDHPVPLPNGTPVIGLTLRYDRLDNFFFCLFHELGHVVKHIATSKAELFLDDLDQSSAEKAEKQADEFAVRHLVPEKEWRQFWEVGDFEPENVRRVAKRLGIHGAILAGRVRNEKNDYQILSRLVHEAKIRHLLPPGERAG